VILTLGPWPPPVITGAPRQHRRTAGG
jgi:hypothetical protein